MTTDPRPAASMDSEQKVRVTLELSQRTIAFIDAIRTELGFRSRGIIIEKLLDELIIDHEGHRPSELRAGLRWWSPLALWYWRLRHRCLTKV